MGLKEVDDYPEWFGDEDGSSGAEPPRLTRLEEALHSALGYLSADAAEGDEQAQRICNEARAALANTETGTPLGYRIPPEQIELVASALEFASTYAPEPNLEADKLAASLRAADTEREENNE
jgi:hypothetical protein